jgi:hypothetical protein
MDWGEQLGRCAPQKEEEEEEENKKNKNKKALESTVLRTAPEPPTQLRNRSPRSCDQWIVPSP